MLRGKRKEIWATIAWLCLLLSVGIKMGCGVKRNLHGSGPCGCSDNSVVISMDNCTREESLKYTCMIQSRINESWRYPYEAMEKQLEGDAVVEFKVGRDGELLSTRIVKTSGHKMLDDEIIRAIATEAPLEKMPKCATKGEILVRGNFKYKLPWKKD